MDWRDTPRGLLRLVRSDCRHMYRPRRFFRPRCIICGSKIR